MAKETSSKSTSRSTKTRKAIATKRTPSTSRKPATMMDMGNDYESMVPSKNAKPTNSKRTTLLFGLLAVLIFTAYAFRYLIIPATVNGKPIFMWTYLSQLHKRYGNQVIGQLIDIELLNQTAKNQGINIQSSEVEAELQTLSNQVEKSGGLDAFLASQGMTVDEAKQQIELNLKLHKILADQATVSAEEITSEYENNMDYFEGEGVSEEDAKLQIEDGLKKQKVQSLIPTWFSEQKANSKVSILMPGLGDIQ